MPRVLTESLVFCRVPEELDGLMVLMESENSIADKIQEDPSKGPCTMLFLEENILETLYQLLSLDRSANLIRCVLKVRLQHLRPQSYCRIRSLISS